MRIRTLLGVATLACALPMAAAAQKRDVDLKAADGTLLKATYFSPGKPGPGVILLHMCNSQRKVWENLATMLTAHGMHVVTMDYRGFGESGGRRIAELSNQERQQMVAELWPQDIRGALAYLTSQAGVDRNRVGAAGGSCGVDNAIRLAMRQPEVKTLVLLAGNTGQPGQEYLGESAWMPVLGVAAEDDGPAVPDMHWLIGFSSHPASRIKVYPKGGHGTDIFAVHKDLEPMIADWFQQHLVKTPVVQSSAIGPAGPSARLIEGMRQPGGATRLLAQYRDARKARTMFVLPPENAINAAGYELLGSGRVADATALFELNVEAFPTSANSYDSLSDAYLRAGDRAKALELAKKTLEVLERDTRTAEDFKRRIRQGAEEKIKQLSGDGAAARPPGL